MARFGKAGEVRQCAFGIGWVMQVKVRFSVAGRVRLVVLCSGTALIGWNGKAGQGSSRYGAMWCGWFGGLWHGRLLYGLFRFGRRVMVSLGAVLCGTVMYGLVRLARLVLDRYVLASLGKV